LTTDNEDTTQPAYDDTSQYYSQLNLEIDVLEIFGEDDTEYI